MLKKSITFLEYSYRLLFNKKQTLGNLLDHSPLKGMNIDVDRNKSLPREILFK